MPGCGLPPPAPQPSAPALLSLAPGVYLSLLAPAFSPLSLRGPGPPAAEGVRRLPQACFLVARGRRPVVARCLELLCRSSKR